MQFTGQQLEIIDQFGRGQAVLAGAGCGKTTTLVAKCLNLLKSNPKSRFCAVSFTEKSVRDLKEALAEGLHQEGLFDQRHHHWVKTIHGLCATIIQEFPSAAGLQGGERILLEDESSRLWERAVDALWSSNESKEIGDSAISLLERYSKNSLEVLLAKLRNLISFGVREWADKPELKDLWICFESVHRRYLHAKTRMGVLDFNDLEIYALKALELPYVRKHFHVLFDLVLVDEFQDTNPVQGKILEYFARPGFTNLCIVGDPKQSIYRFRDADVSVFFDLTERLPLKHLLTENYRSRPEIIHFVNQVCAPVFEASELVYEPLTPGRQLPLSPEPLVWRLAVKGEQDLANFFKAKIAEGQDLSEYAILARSLKGKTQNVLKSLNQAGIPYLLGSGGRFYADPRVQELVAFLKGFISSEQRLSQWTALRAPWINVDEKELLGWKENLYTHFFESAHPVALALKAHFQNPTVRPGQILEILFEILDEEMSVPVLTLWHKAEELSAQGRVFEEVIQSFVEAIQADKIEKEIPPPAQKGAVRVMTIHGSKGLQFPRVILLDFYGKQKTGSGGKIQDLIWDRKKGVHLFHRHEDGTKDNKNEENQYWDELEKRSAIAESKRLFYVAITRPQEELILYWPDIQKPVADEPLKSDDWRAWVAAGALPPEKDFSVSTISNNEKGEVYQLPPIQKVKDFTTRFRPRHSPSEWRVLSQCGLRYYWKWIDPQQTLAAQESTELTPEELKKEKWKELASEKGERVHALFENEDWDGLQKIFKTERANELVNTVRQYLGTESTSNKIYREFGFEVPLNEDEALVGMMDRLEVDADQKCIRVIDYKWTTGDKSPEALLQDYQLQLQLYAWAASKMVDFIPSRIEAVILHLTQKNIQKVELGSDLLDLATIEEMVHTLHSQVNEKQNPRAGAHCKFCEFVQQCPSPQRT